jgi:hypothetical protein
MLPRKCRYLSVLLKGEETHWKGYFHSFQKQVYATLHELDNEDIAMVSAEQVYYCLSFELRLIVQLGQLFKSLLV